MILFADTQQCVAGNNKNIAVKFFSKALIEHSNVLENVVSPQYSCSDCGKSYVWKQGLNTHRRLHCGKEPRFQCPHCPKKCYQRGNLDSHIRNVHTNIFLNEVIYFILINVLKSVV